MHAGKIFAHIFMLSSFSILVLGLGGSDAMAGSRAVQSLQLVGGCNEERPSTHESRKLLSFPMGEASASFDGSVVLASIDCNTDRGPDWHTSTRKTDDIVNQLAAARDFCDSFRFEYQIDCLAERLKKVARSMPSDGDYADARRVLTRAATKLARLARANQSPDLPRGVASTGGDKPIVTQRKLTPVRSETLDATRKAALAIITEAETTLLRSSENSTRRMVHYQRIAEALGSNKVLLRSA